VQKIVFEKKFQLSLKSTENFYKRLSLKKCALSYLNCSFEKGFRRNTTQVDYFTFYQEEKWEQGSMCDLENVLFVSIISALLSKPSLFDRNRSGTC